MKKICIAFMTIVAVIITSCTGDQGPSGPPGNDGGLVVSKSFEKVVTFNSANNYQDIEAYGFEVLPSDVTLVYVLWETLNGQDVWRLTPQTVEFNEGTLTYNYDFTQTDVRFFLDGTIDFNLLDLSYTQNQVFRVVVVPADNNGRMDYSDLSVVMDAYGITSFEKRN